jgi:hypothetical protein
MSKNKECSITDRDVAEAFETLFDETLLPESREEAEEIILEAGIDPEKWDNEMNIMVQKLLRDSPLNWRNIAQEEIFNIVSDLENIPKRVNKTIQELWELIDKALEELYPSKQNIPVAYRNLEEVTKEDLASLLQELEYQLHEERKMDDE